MPLRINTESTKKREAGALRITGSQAWAWLPEAKF